MLLTSLNTPSGFSPCVPGFILGLLLLVIAATAVPMAFGEWIGSSEDERVEIDRKGTVVLVSRIAMLFTLPTPQ